MTMIKTFYNKQLFKINCFIDLARSLEHKHVNKKQFTWSCRVQNPGPDKPLRPLRDIVLQSEFNKKNNSIDHSWSEKSILEKQIYDEAESSKKIRVDMKKIEPAQSAVEKMANNETPTKEEKTALSELTDEYPHHLQEYSDSESDSESKLLGYPKATPKDNLNDLNDYLGFEHRLKLSTMRESAKKLVELLSCKGKETVKRRMEDSSDNESCDSSSSYTNKKTRQSVHDFVENLPGDHNPLDDIGSD